MENKETEVRRRGRSDKQDKADGARPAKRRPPSKFVLQWDLLFWLLGCFAMLYFTNFASHLLFNPAVKR